MRVLINLVGHITYHPYADRDYLSLMSRDTRSETSLLRIHDGLVYLRNKTREVLIEGSPYMGFLLTKIPLSSARGCSYYCLHQYMPAEGETLKTREVQLRFDEDILIVDEGYGNHQVILDLGFKHDLPELKDNSTLWEHLTE